MDPFLEKACGSNSENAENPLKNAGGAASGTFPLFDESPVLSVEALGAWVKQRYLPKLSLSWPRTWEGCPLNH